MKKLNVNTTIFLLAFATSYMMVLIHGLGDLYHYQGYLSGMNVLNCVGTAFSWFFVPYSMIFPPFLIVTLPIIIVFGLIVRYAFSRKKNFSSRIKFLVLTVILLAWCGLNDFALEILASA